MSPNHLRTDNESDIWLDISRMLWRTFRKRLTGIDRVEIAYAETLLRTIPDRVHFVAYNYWSRGFRMLSLDRASSLIEGIGPAWRSGNMARVTHQSLAQLVESLTIARPVPRYHRGDRRPVYINVSTHPLHLIDRVDRMIERTGAVFLPLVHDLIPMEYPEFVPPAWTKHHRNRMETVRRFASGIISNSMATTKKVRRYVSDLPIVTTHLGVADHFSATASVASAPGACKMESGRPYFLCVGTIEPRKNHLLLLNIWRRLAQTMGDATPRLVLVGRRGWENEQVLDVLDRCGSIRHLIEERGMVPDGELAGLMAGARALLMPSFTEGYGLPVAESMAMGAPVICSDIAAHREIGGGVPEFIDPLDGPAWISAITDYATEGSPLRAAQLGRMTGWSAPTWQGHIDTVLQFAASLSVRRVRVVQGRWSRTPWISSIPRHHTTNAATAVSEVISQRLG